MSTTQYIAEWLRSLGFSITVGRGDSVIEVTNYGRGRVLINCYDPVTVILFRQRGHDLKQQSGKWSLSYL